MLYYNNSNHYYYRLGDDCEKEIMTTEVTAMGGERHSKQRETVYEAVKSTKTHPTADWVYLKVREQIPDISLGTVYRNLKYLCEAGRLITVETDGESHRFDADTSTHAHFVCDTCGGVSDVTVGSRRTEALEEKGYEVRSEKRLFYGLCPECAAKTKS